MKDELQNLVENRPSTFHLMTIIVSKAKNGSKTSNNFTRSATVKFRSFYMLGEPGFKKKQPPIHLISTIQCQINLGNLRNIQTTPWAIKKRATFIFTITLANVDRLQ